MTKWFIYYGPDDEMVNSEHVTPFRIKRRADVQVIIQENSDHNWVTVSGFDYYIWDDRGGGALWFGVDIFGLHHYLLSPGYKCVLFGVVIDKGRFREIFDRAWEKIGEKTGFERRERRPDE